MTDFNDDFFNDKFDFSTKHSGDELFLVFITKVGELNDEPVYEFIFSNDPESACGPQWENICEFNVEPPDSVWIQKIGTLQSSSLELTLLEELDNFRYLDGVFGAVSLGFEYIDNYSKMANLNDSILKFMYGEPLEEVVAKLKERNLELLLS